MFFCVCVCVYECVSVSVCVSMCVCKLANSIYPSSVLCGQVLFIILPYPGSLSFFSKRQRQRQNKKQNKRKKKWKEMETNERGRWIRYPLMESAENYSWEKNPRVNIFTALSEIVRLFFPN